MPVRKDKEPQQQKQNRKRHNACQNQVQRARLCLTTHKKVDSM
jgi:hypothetical protein